MKIGVIGSGDVAKTLTLGFLNEGHELTIGSRTPDKLVEWRSAYPSIKLGDFNETAKFAEVIVLAVKGVAAVEVLAQIPAEFIANKIIIDTTNPIADSPPVNGVLNYFTSTNESLMERLQKTYPLAKFVKAFNSVGSAHMIHPKFELKPTMFICGNDDSAKQVVSQLLSSLGWEAADYGKVESARAIESLCILWCLPGFLRGDWSHALKMMA